MFVVKLGNQQTFVGYYKNRIIVTNHNNINYSRRYNNLIIRLLLLFYNIPPMRDKLRCIQHSTIDLVDEKEDKKAQ